MDCRIKFGNDSFTFQAALASGCVTSVRLFFEMGLSAFFMLLCGKYNAHFSGSLKKRCGNKRLADLSPAYTRVCLCKAGKTSMRKIAVATRPMNIVTPSFCLFFRQ